MRLRRPEPSEPCSCGHPYDAHEHYRRGTDCALCGPAVCARFRPRRRLGLVRPR